MFKLYWNLQTPEITVRTWLTTPPDPPLCIHPFHPTPAPPPLSPLHSRTKHQSSDVLLWHLWELDGVHVLGLQQPHEVLVRGTGLQVVTDNPHLEHPTPLLVSSHLIPRYLFIEGARLDGEEGRGQERGEGEGEEGRGGMRRGGEGRGGIH